ncbi:MAG: 4Fe-4S binding protein [Coriobacteriales bacterium]|nr:4Fe-4S binding protein [Coriobacteriales bacterium]
MAVSIDSDICTGCGTCVDSCPLELIEMCDAIATLNDPDSCIECGSCVDACAFSAITEP